MNDQSVLIDALQRENAALHENDRLYRSVFDMLNGFAYCRMLFENGQPQDFIYLLVNHAFEIQTGLKDVVGKRVTEVVPGIREADPRLFEIYGRVALTGQPEQFELFVEALHQWFAVSVNSPAPEHFVAVFDVITERKRSEAALHDSEERLREVLENSRDVVYRRDFQDTTHDYMSPAFVRIAGYTPEEMAALPVPDLLELTHPDDRAKVQRMMVESRQDTTEASHQLEFRFKHKDGQYRWFQDQFSTLHGDQGQPVARIGSVRDITDRKRAEEGLQKSEAKYRLLFENMEEGFALHEVITDEAGRALDFRFLDANVAYERHTGQKPQDIIGRTMLELMPQADRRQIENYGRVALTGEPLTSEYFSKTFNRHLRVRAFSPQRGRFATIFEDITEQRRTEEALRESEANLRAVVEDQTETISRYRSDNVYTFVNESFCRLFGKTSAELVGRNWQPEVFAEDLPMIEAKVSTISPTNPVVVIENRVYAGDGEIRWMQFVNRGFFDATGNLMEVQAVGRDITDRKRTEEALRESEMRAQALLRAIPDMIFRLDRQGVFLDYKADVSDLYVQPEASLIGKRNRDMTPPEFADLIDQQINTTLITGRLQTFEYQLPIPGRGLRDYEARMVTSGPDEVTVIVRDATERNLGEKALRASEQKHRRLFESMSQGVIYYDADGRVISANPAAEHILGLSLDQLLGETLVDPAWKVVHDDGSDLPMEEHPVRVAMRSGQAVEHIILGVFNPLRSTQLWLAVTAIPLFQPGEDTPFQVYSTFEDITDRKETEVALRETNLRLKEAQAIGQMGSFVYDVRNDVWTTSPELDRIFGIEADFARIGSDFRY